MFDPYEKLLGIPKDQRPLTYYKLLGVSPRETAEEAIEEAAVRQMKRVRRQQEGPQAQFCARLLKEIEQAKAALLDPAKRKRYDALLRAKIAQKKAAELEAIEEVEEVEEVTEDEANDEESATEDESPRRTKAKGKNKGASAKPDKKRQPVEEKKRSLLLPILGIAGGLVLLLGVGTVLAIVFLGSKSPEPTKQFEQMVRAPGPPVQPEPPAPTKKEEKPEVKPLPPPPPPPPPVTPPPAPSAALAKPPSKGAKLPVPPEAAQAKAEAALKETYKTDYAKPSKEDKLALAAKFLQPGREDRSDPAKWFVLLREARELAVQAERPRLAVEAIDEIDKWFQIDALAMKLKALTPLGQASSDVAVRTTGQVALNQIKGAIAADNYDTAGQLLTLADTTLHKVKAESRWLDKVEARKKEIEEARKEYQPVAEAKKKLATASNDAEANLTVGKHLCYLRNRWDDGLPLLAKGSDAGLKALAQKDVAWPPNVKEAIAVADGWWALGKPGRATYWYELAEPLTNAQEKPHVQARLKELEDRQPAGPPRLLPGGPFARANLEDRVLLLREGGGSMRTEEAVERGLEWLAKHQAPNGSWSADQLAVIGKCNCSEPAEEKHDVAATCFGLLPFLGAGETHKHGKHTRTVGRGLNWLLNQQKENGNFSDNMYENALATMVLCEASGLGPDGSLKDRAQLAVSYIVRAQNARGGWGYSPGADPGDTSVSGWQFAALKAGYYAKLLVPPLTFARMGEYLKTVADPDGLGYGYSTPSHGRSTSAVGLLCLEYLGVGPHHPLLAKGIDQLVLPENFVTKDQPSIYFLFYATQAMHHYGGKKWEIWNARTRDLLLDIQDPGTAPGHEHQKGSFSPAGDDFAKQGGRLMFSSLALITLETYYYHVPLNGYGPAVLEE